MNDESNEQSKMRKWVNFGQYEETNILQTIFQRRPNKTPTMIVIDPATPQFSTKC